MQEGYVRAESGEAVLVLRVRTSRELEQQLEAVVDTGFNGALVLPRPVIESLSAPATNTYTVVELADGSEARLPEYRVWVIWYGRLRIVTALSAGTDTALAGMTLLAGSRLTIDALPEGSVTVEEL